MERLEDLHDLLLALRKLPDRSLEIDAEPVAPAKLVDLLFGPLEVQHAASVGVPQDDVLHHRVGVHQLAVLVHHADPQLDGIQRRLQLDFLAADVDLAFVRLHEPVDDLHQRGLARAVFAQDGMDLAGAHLKVDRVVGDDTGIPLGYPPQLQNRAAADSACKEFLVHECFFSGIVRPSRALER